ncbi:hypothetical protein QEN19_004239 [Hanseniaspora menglaensis]
MMVESLYHDPLLPITSTKMVQNDFGVPNSRQILRICINLKKLVDTLIPDVYDDNADFKIDKHIVKMCYDACGGNRNSEKSKMKYQSSLIFCLLTVKKWCLHLSKNELHLFNLYTARANLVENLAVRIVSEEETKSNKNLIHLFVDMMLKKYIINENDNDSRPANALEMCCDLHCTSLISTSAIQRLQVFLWRGWIVQSENGVFYLNEPMILDTRFITHFTSERLKTPKYQNLFNLFISLIYLGIYTFVVNDGKLKVGLNPIGILETVFYGATIGFLLDEAVKLYNIGLPYMRFWNIFNDFMYTVITAAMAVRIISLHTANKELDILSYRILALVAPMMWSRLLFFLDSVKFIGNILVIIKQMLKESILFFVLLVTIIIGFVQAFLAMDSSDGSSDQTLPILENLLVGILGDTDFSIFETFAYPYTSFLYYLYRFILSLILINILIAIFSTSYSNIVENSNAEFLALNLEKTLRFIRMPDDSVYIPPLNLLELLLQPISYFIRVKYQKQAAKKLKQFHGTLLQMLFAPALFIIAINECRDAKRAYYNKLKGKQLDANEVDYPFLLSDGFVEGNENDFSRSIFDMNSLQESTEATNIKNRKTRQLQKEAEIEDPEFLRNSEDWFKRLNKLKDMV